MAEYEKAPYIVVERHTGSLSAFLWGALLGAGAALLLAPRSGEETRRELRRSAQRLRETAEGAVRQVQESVASTVDDLRDQLTGRVESARSAMEAGREAARRTREDLERRVQAARAEWQTEDGHTRSEPTLPDEEPLL